MLSRRLYTWLLRLLLPAALARLYWRSLSAPDYRRRVLERLALAALPPASDLWVHAVSVGEVQAAEGLLRRWLERAPESRLLVTTTTPTGAARLRELFGDRVVHRYTPFDLPGIVGRFLRHARPRLLILMETEIWPNMLGACAQAGVPAVLANARLSERSARGYARFGRLTAEALAGLRLIAAQTDADAARFLALGAEPSRTLVTGSLKFDLRQPASQRETAETLRRAWGPQRAVWVAASTHEGEEAALLQTHRRIMEALPSALLVLVPRHPERFDRVASLVAKEGLTMARRSRRDPCEEVPVLLGDTMGELPAFLTAADAAFIGGSLVPTGGHNLLEAAAVGVPAAVGPHTFNFAQITDMLIAEGATRRVASAEELADLMLEGLSDAALRARIGEQGRAVVERNRGALDRLMRAIDGAVGTCVSGRSTA